MRTVGLGRMELLTISHIDNKISSLSYTVTYAHRGGDGNPTMQYTVRLGSMRTTVHVIQFRKC